MTWIPLDTNARREGNRIGNPAVWKIRAHYQTLRCNRKTDSCSQWFNSWTHNFTRCRCSEVKE